MRVSLDKVNVQLPLAGSFTSECLDWICCEAWFPADRFEDFMKGETSRPDCPCQFKVRKTEDPLMKTGKKTIRYWCCYGPEDLRDDVQTQLPPRECPIKGRGSRPYAARRVLGTSQNRGCQCHFAVSFYSERSEVCKVKWMHRAHMDLNKLPCHGILDPTSLYGNALVAPKISADLRLFIERLLRSRVTPKDIILEYQMRLRREADQGSGMWSRDYLLGMKDVLNIQQAIRRQHGVYSSCDAIAVRLWVESNGEKVLFYQERDTAKHIPFILVFASTWMLQNLVTLGHQSCVSMDATFGTNMYEDSRGRILSPRNENDNLLYAITTISAPRYEIHCSHQSSSEYQLFTILCFDKFQNGVPCVWALMERGRQCDLEVVLTSVKRRVIEYKEQSLSDSSMWTPTCFLVDDAPEECAALNAVFPGIPVNLCLWHVRKAWVKNLHGKIKDPFTKAQINRQLGDIMYNSDEDSHTLSLRFMETWKEETQFIEYYRTYWHSRIQRWAIKYRTYAHANQNSQGSIEKYHSTLKQHLRGSRKGKMSRRVSWLVVILTETIEAFFWCASELKRQGRLRNRIIASLLLPAIRKAREISDGNVMIRQSVEGKKAAWVTSSSHPDRIHECNDFDTDHATCTCGHAIQGNTCKHQIKCLLMAGFSEMELLAKLGTKWGTVAGGFENLGNSGTKENVPIIGLDTPLEYMAEPVEPIDMEGSGETSRSVKKDCIVTTCGTLSVNIREQVSKEDFDHIVHEIWTSVNHSERLSYLAICALRNTQQRILDGKARSETINGAAFVGAGGTSSKFEPIPGADRSLIRRKDFVEKFMGKRKKRQGDHNMTSASILQIENSEPIACEPREANFQFSQQRSMRVTSMQQVLDREALQQLDLNRGPDIMSSKQPRKIARQTKRNANP